MNKNLIDNELKWKLDRIVPVKALRHTLRKKLKKKKKKRLLWSIWVPLQSNPGLDRKSFVAIHEEYRHVQVFFQLSQPTRK